jgi:hypothetical protein
MANNFVTRLADIVREHLPDSFQPLLWVPVVALLIFVIVTLIVRATFPALSWAAHLLLDTLVAAALLLEFAMATPFRVIRRGPPAMVYSIGDTVPSLAEKTHSVLAGGLARVRRSVGGYGLPALLSVLLLAGWNSNYCTPPSNGQTSCQHPAQIWLSEITKTLGMD